ncbi:MAG: type III pantothenate kinase, partial [Eggerthellaceae bacterium]
MLLAIDVGNTQTVVGIYQDGSLQYRWRVATNKSHTSDELRVKLVPLLAPEGLKLDDVRGVALASVVPALTMAWCAAAYRMIGKDALVCSAETAGSLFEADYPNPHEIGADRVADAVAAKALYGAPVIVVDFGTATNMEVVDADGRFIGGVIAPGVETSASALFSHATKLGAIDLVDPHTAIGHNTEEA